MEHQPNYGRTPFVPRLTPPPPGIPEDLHMEAQSAALQAYYEVYNSLNYHNPYLQQQLYMQNSYNTPVEQIDATPVEQIDKPVEKIDDTYCSEDLTLWSKEKFMECITQEDGSIALQEALNSSSAAKDRILELFNSLDTDEIVPLSQDMYGNFFISVAIKYANKSLVERFMGDLIDNPPLIQQMSTDTYSYRVIISLIVLGKNLEMYNDFAFALKDASNISPFIIQQLVKHVPSYRIWLFEEIKKGEFPPTQISSKNLPILGMYPFEEIGDFLKTEKMDDDVRGLMKRKGLEAGWDRIHQNVLKGSIPKFLDEERSMETFKKKRKATSKKI